MRFVPVSKRPGVEYPDGTLWRCLACGYEVKDPTPPHTCKRRLAA